MYPDSHKATRGCPQSEPRVDNSMGSRMGWMMLFALAGSARFVTFSPHVFSVGPRALCL